MDNYRSSLFRRATPSPKYFSSVPKMSSSIAQEPCLSHSCSQKWWASLVSSISYQYWFRSGRMGLSALISNFTFLQKLGPCDPSLVGLEEYIIYAVRISRFKYAFISFSSSYQIPWTDQIDGFPSNLHLFSEPGPNRSLNWRQAAKPHSCVNISSSHCNSSELMKGLCINRFLMCMYLIFMIS